MATSRPIPRDGRLISLILASKGIEDAEERVIHQLLDFSYRYTADVLQSAQQLADHAARPGAPKIEKEDVEVAIQMRKRQEFFEPPPRDYLSSIAQELNAQPLPILSETFDILRLPPPHQRIAEVNFNIVPDRDLVLSEEEEDDDSDEEEDEEEEDAKSEEATIGRPAEEAEGSDEEMEEVGIGAERVVDEDYDA